jgi:hypothetical protein
MTARDAHPASFPFGVRCVIYENVDGAWREWRTFWNTYTAVMLWCRATGSVADFTDALDAVRDGSMCERSSVADGRPLLIGFTQHVLDEIALRRQ